MSEGHEQSFRSMKPFTKNSESECSGGGWNVSIAAIFANGSNSYTSFMTVQLNLVMRAAKAEADNVLPTLLFAHCIIYYCPYPFYLAPVRSDLTRFVPVLDLVEQV